MIFLFPLCFFAMQKSQGWRTNPVLFCRGSDWKAMGEVKEMLWEIVSQRLAEGLLDTVSAVFASLRK